MTNTILADQSWLIVKSVAVTRWWFKSITPGFVHSALLSTILKKLENAVGVIVFLPAT